MKKLAKSIPLLFILVVCTNCSMNHANKSTTEVDNNDQFFADTLNDAAPATTEFGAPVTEVTETQVAAPVAPIQEPAQYEPAVSELAKTEASVPTPEIQKPESKEEVAVNVQTPVMHEEPAFEEQTENKNELTSYQVKNGDTWMIIAQKLLGNPLKWKELQKYNKQFKKSTELTPGVTLTYMPPVEPVIQPEGLPYLIKRNDTLPKISYKVYGTKSTWDVIYYNNRQTIKTPDVIYSGFIIYTPEKDQVGTVRAQMAAVHFDMDSVRKPASVKKHFKK
ncbi:MAG: LysM peptidoglycan-binding domain-containing protein [Rhizobacter sp.]|nr:LysM peptidoglycan-binding domain-containing protein [Bacteriovorax sp.]